MDSVSSSNLLTGKQVCTLLNISGKTLQRLCARRDINFIRLSGKAFRFRPEAVNLFIAQREVRST